jgi:hypothetical protein
MQFPTAREIRKQQSHHDAVSSDIQVKEGIRMKTEARCTHIPSQTHLLMLSPDTEQ